MKLLIDLNVFLDIVQERKPFYKFSSIVVSEILKNKATGIVPSHAVTTLYYLIARSRDKQIAVEFTKWLLSKFSISPSYKTTFLQALGIESNDFEDAVIMVNAEKKNCDYIITRNISD